LYAWNFKIAAPAGCNMSTTFAHRITNLKKALGQNPTVDELLEVAQIHKMTPERYWRRPNDISEA